jgi:hypothetical protein
MALHLISHEVARRVQCGSVRPNAMCARTARGADWATSANQCVLFGENRTTPSPRQFKPTSLIAGGTSEFQSGGREPTASGSYHNTRLSIVHRPSSALLPPPTQRVLCAALPERDGEPRRLYPSTYFCAQCQPDALNTCGTPVVQQNTYSLLTAQASIPFGTHHQWRFFRRRPTCAA